MNKPSNKATTGLCAPGVRADDLGRNARENYSALLLVPEPTASK
jgi:hypothetical protein